MIYIYTIYINIYMYVDASSRCGFKYIQYIYNILIYIYKIATPYTLLTSNGKLNKIHNHHTTAQQTTRTHSRCVNNPRAGADLLGECASTLSALSLSLLP